MKQVSVKKMVFAALCVALGVVLPLALHGVPAAGKILLPMHLPVLLCGMACGWPYGLACGILAPLMSHLVTAMPPAARLLSMICELAAYGVLAGLARTHIHLKRRPVTLYVQLISAMLLGRVVYGVTNALIFSAGTYTFPIFFASAFVTALPGIALQLVVVPPLLLLLEKAGLLSPPDPAPRS